MTREEAKQMIESMGKYLSEGNPIWETEPVKEATRMAIEALHREEAEEKGYCHRIRPSNVEVVVRCKDCRHKEHCHETVAHTKEHDGFREHWSEPIEWCSRGERKGGDDE